jgi:NAD-dependent DNA ligase
MPVYIPRRSEALHLLQAVRDEAHRFAVTFHRKLRAKRVIASQLDVLKGLGAKRRKKLIDHFGSFEQIKTATLEEIEACEGIPKKLALELFTFMQDLKNKPKAKPLLTGMEPATEDEGESIKSVKSVKGASAKGDSLPMVAEDAAQYDDGEIRETSILDQEDEQEFYAEDVEADEERLPEADEDEELG